MRQADIERRLSNLAKARIASAKRLLQQNRHEAAETVLLGYLRRGACAAAAVGAAKLCQLSGVAVVRVAEVKLGSCE
jgi:hypothetical protein